LTASGGYRIIVVMHDVRKYQPRRRRPGLTCACPARMPRPAFWDGLPR